MLRLPSLSSLTLLVALGISAIAEWYAIIGLTTIFSGAPIPVIIFGIFLGIGKIVTVVWLRKYWSVAPWLLKSYLLIAAIGLSCLTSIGIFGYLSKAHADSAIAPAEKLAKLEHIDTKIQVLTDQLTEYKDELALLDKQVSSYLERGTEVYTVTKSVQLRRNQAADRKRIQASISEVQTSIAQLREQRVPVASELKKLEAEVGPIKYVASMIYGDNPDATLLDRAVRWMIVMLVIVFDPLAVALVLAANHSRELEDKLNRQKEPTILDTPKDVAKDTEDTILAKADLSPATLPIKESAVSSLPVDVVSTKQPRKKKQTKAEKTKNEIIKNEVNNERKHTQLPIEVTGVTREIIRPSGDYIIYQGKKTHVRVLRETSPKLFMTREEEKLPILRYGVEFPKIAASGDRFTRIDMLPHKLFLFASGEWVFVSDLPDDKYLNDSEYLNTVRLLVDAGYAPAEFFGKHTATKLVKT